MLQGSIARRYAQALFDLAREKGVIDTQESELKQALGIFAENPSLQSTFVSSQTSSNMKLEVIDRVFSSFSEMTRGFLALLVRKHREGVFGGAVQAFSRLADQARGVLEVEARSAVPMEPGELKAIEDRLIQGGARSVRFSTQVDPDLIGGVVLSVGDRLYDGSVRTRLKRLKQLLARA